MPYSPLGRGFLTGEIKSPEDLAADDWRRNNPRFQGSNFENNLKIVDHVKEIAVAKGSTLAQVALAWVLAQGEDFLPIPGTKRVKYLEDNAGAVSVKLTQSEIERLSHFEAEGDRYPAVAMQFLTK